MLIEEVLVILSSGLLSCFASSGNADSVLAELFFAVPS